MVRWALLQVKIDQELLFLNNCFNYIVKWNSALYVSWFELVVITQQVKVQLNVNLVFQISLKH